MYGSFCFCPGNGPTMDQPGRTLAKDTHDARPGRVGEPRPAAMSLLQWELNAGQEREKELMARDA